jgi:hypothetical protein
VQSVELANGESKHLDMVLTKESAAGRMQFSDEPNFTVAGVTDWSNVGLHGSDANVRTSESLAKETASLKPGAAAPKSAAASEANSHRLLGDAHEKGGDPLAAVNEYEKAVKLDPSEEIISLGGRNCCYIEEELPRWKSFTKAPCSTRSRNA